MTAAESSAAAGDARCDFCGDIFTAHEPTVRLTLPGQITATMHEQGCRDAALTEHRQAPS